MSENSIIGPTEKFLVTGIITSKEFQKSRYVTAKLHRCFPKLYEKPEIRPMLNVEWDEYLMKEKRKYGKRLWSLRKLVVIFLNGEYLGDDMDLMMHISKKYQFSLKMDWYEIGKCHLVDYLKEIMDKFRQLAYLTVSINHRVIGTMMFELYNDLVPLACENFLNKCTANVNGYTGTPIQRIMKSSWIQCGGWKLPERKMRCENYVIPHNRRGILCMCNNGRHRDNSTQFFITLAATPWMDYRYVAFGQLIHGSEILKQIEEVPIQYQTPLYPINIVMSGEITFDSTPDFVTTEELQELQNKVPMSLLDSLIGPPRAGDLSSSGSNFSERKFAQGIYCLESDLKNYLPFMHLPDYLMPDDSPEKVGDADGNNTSQSEFKPCATNRQHREMWAYSGPTFSDTTI